MAQSIISDEDLAALVERTAEAASALISGDVRRYLALIPHADDYTLMSPFGGDPIRGVDDSPENVEAQERFFAGPDEAEQEAVHS